MTLAIETQKLAKSFGSIKALKGIDLTVEAGEVFGFLGPNGAGKTTTIRLLLDLIRPTAGSAKVLGMDARTDSVAIRKRVGYLPSELHLDPHLRAGQLLDHLAALQGGVDTAWRQQLVDRLGLDPSRRMLTMSTGNKKKVGIVQAFMHRPDLLILDEPTSGLDPLLQREFLNLVEEERSRGAAIFLSSHVLAEIEEVADRVAIIREGELVTIDTVAGLTRTAERKLVLRFGQAVPSEAFASLDGVRDVSVVGDTVTANITGSPDAVIKAAARFPLTRIETHAPSLEDIFLAYYKKAS